VSDGLTEARWDPELDSLAVVLEEVAGQRNTMALLGLGPMLGIGPSVAASAVPGTKKSTISLRCNSLPDPPRRLRRLIDRDPSVRSDWGFESIVHDAVRQRSQPRGLPSPQSKGVPL
jgi:hypothetical protein